MIGIHTDFPGYLVGFDIQDMAKALLFTVTHIRDSWIPSVTPVDKSEQVKNAIRNNETNRANLLARSSSAASGLSALPVLAPVRGAEIEIMCMPRESLPLPLGSSTPFADGTVHKTNGRYTIFIVDGGLCAEAQTYCQDLMSWFLVSHEYCHILNGDVFEDDPWKALLRRWFGIDGIDPERKADGYAAFSVAEEMKRQGRETDAETLLNHARSLSWISPHFPLSV
jgi:hypothetical protein